MLDTSSRPVFSLRVTDGPNQALEPRRLAGPSIRANGFSALRSPLIERASRPLARVAHLRHSAYIVRMTLVLLVSVCGGCLRAAAKDGAAAADRIAALHESFHFVPVALDEQVSVREKDPVVMLERLTIMGSIMRRDLAKEVEDRFAREADAAFTWKKGGLLSSRDFGRFQMDTGVWLSLGEKITGAIASRDQFIKVELLRIKW